ncbi:hypothetical protein CLV59_108162 [Chitinophaga dinghuensis]|uniref:Uncharacterized protein n=1 Tax=Chitinophaga dinghuensis TaxID=1539050 RepID=A0A327VY05_9BACT|nr:hypothetical protein [Chitinophaga dinghuensis]RAJ76642.1 hypothetical protein CLV59_108162 [Chitinophaga dinghuensis]
MQLFNGRLYPEDIIPYLEQFDKEKYLNELKAAIDLSFQQIALHAETALYTCCIATNIYDLETTVSFDTFENSEKYRGDLLLSLEKRYHQKMEQGKLTKRDRPPAQNHVTRNYDQPEKYTFPRIANIKHASIPRNFEFYTQRKCWYEIFPIQQQALAYAVTQLHTLSHLHPNFEIFFIGMESKEGFIYQQSQNQQ